MTLGLAVGSASGVYLAIDSAGLPLPANYSLFAKVHELQNQPLVGLLTAGGLEYWNDVVREYHPQPSIADAASEVKRILDKCMGTHNKAFGLVCGYENRSPKRYRINRNISDQCASISEESILDTQPLGVAGAACTAAQNADTAIREGQDMLVAIVEAIQSQITGDLVKGPVQVRIIRP